MKTCKRVFATFLVASAAGFGPSAAAAHDELYYSAAACVPVHLAHWQGNGSTGFEFTNVGSWANRDRNATQILVCPVPYRRNAADLAPIVARVVIDDFNPAVFARAFLCGRASGPNNQHCVSSDNFPTVTATSTIELSLTPRTSTRFVWLEIHIPPDADDDNPFTLDGRSSLVGYRIFRN
jgi:hypothetical protein